MRTRVADGADRSGLGFAAKQVADHARSLARLELELAKLELKEKLTAFATGLGLLAAAVVIGFFAVAFLLAAGAAGLATFLPTWLALLVAAVVLLLLTGGLGLAGARLVKRGTPPVPEQALDEAKRTGEAIRSDGNH